MYKGREGRELNSEGNRRKPKERKSPARKKAQKSTKGVGQCRAVGAASYGRCAEEEARPRREGEESTPSVQRVPSASDR